jgi:hypothetical protein
MLKPTEAPVNVPADHNPRPDSLGRIEQFAATYVLDATSVQVERPVGVVERRLMRHQDVDAVWDRRVDMLENRSAAS